MSRMFAKNLKYYRIAAGLTQEDLAKSTGVTRSSIANYESNRSEPSFEFLCQAVRVLGVTMNELIEDRPEHPNFVRIAQVTDEEMALLQLYRNADPVFKNVAFDILGAHPRRQDDGTNQS